MDFNWIDIQGIGSQVQFPTNDDAGSPVNIGFNFPFYDDEYSQCIINPNGWIGFENDNDGWSNAQIP